MSKVSINIVIYNSEAWLPDLFRSIEAQNFTDYQAIVIDNASTDRGADFVRKNYPQATVLRNHKNIGFAKAHNQAIELAQKINGAASDHYILVANPDLVLEPNFLAEITAVADRYSEYGAFGGKVLRLTKASDADQEQTIKNNIFDTTGLVIKKSRRVVDRGAGEEDQGQYSKIEPVFGVSGALALYRTTALEQASVNGEYFDSHFFCYKEDVDLAWRMQNLGLKSLYVPAAVAYHWRNLKAPQAKKWSILKARYWRRNYSPRLNQLSYRNHWLAILKNDRLVNFVFHSPWIISEELLKFLYLLLFETATALQVFSVLGDLRLVLSWRRALRSEGLTPAQTIRKFFQ